jgi:hypothetical protein
VVRYLKSRQMDVIKEGCNRLEVIEHWLGVLAP